MTVNYYSLQGTKYTLLLQLMPIQAHMGTDVIARGKRLLSEPKIGRGGLHR